MLKNNSIQNNYANLLNSIKKNLTDSFVNVKKTIEYERIRAYWLIGNEIKERVAASNGTLALNKTLYQRISQDLTSQFDLDLTIDTIRRSVKFSKIYETFPEKTPLTFTHYLALIRITDNKKRKYLERKAIQEHLSTTELKNIVSEFNQNSILTTSNITNELNFNRSEPYIYYLKPLCNLEEKTSMYIDCGFKVHIPINSPNIKTNATFDNPTVRCVCSVKENNFYHLKLATRKRKSLFTYAGRILKVIDGDTVDALVDVGFGLYTRDRFRLKGINAPELKTRAGKKSKAFLEEVFKKSKTVVLRTSKEGVYGRWLTDFFVKEGEQNINAIAKEGQYVNQLLLDTGLAEIY